MVRSSGLTLAEIADPENLLRAVESAVQGARRTPAVENYLKRLPHELHGLQRGLLSETVAVGSCTEFLIYDPKPRLISAPVFGERVLHHAVMQHVAPILERTLVKDTYACLRGRGSLAAVLRAQQHSRRFRWYAQLDIRQYFPSVDHYMDDFVFWCDDRRQIVEGLKRVREVVVEQLHLQLRDEPIINRSEHGLSFCGFRVFPGILRVLPRRKRRYVEARRRWEQRFVDGLISSLELQRGYDAAAGILAHADTRAWRQRQLEICPSPAECDEA
jgi:hypothetical protein